MSDRELMRAMDAEQRVRELEADIERLTTGRDAFEKLWIKSANAVIGLQARVAELECSLKISQEKHRLCIARVDVLEEWTKVSLGLKCPSCDDVGWFPVQIDCDEWEQQQCEFCYTVPDSIFNRRAATEQESIDG